MSAQLPGSLRRIYDMLISKKMTIEEIADTANIKKGTAKKYLRQLTKLGLVESDGVYFWAKKPEEEKKEVEEVKVEETKEEIKKEEVKEEVSKPQAPEVKPKIIDKYVDELKAFYFYKGFNQPLLLNIRSIKQLLIALENDFIDEEAISYSVKVGCLQQWLKNVMGVSDLANKIDEVKDLAPSKLKEKVIDILRSFL